MTDLVRAARAYIAAGVPVFPLIPRGKTPFQGSHGLDDATIEPGQIDEWWGRHPDANIGTPTMGWVVLDRDDPEGQTSLEALEEEHGKLPRTLQQVTGGGWHYVFSGSRQGGAAFRPGIDIRSNGNYIVVAPSQHPNGAFYSWADPHQVVPAPQWVMELDAIDRRAGSDRRVLADHRSSLAVVRDDPYVRKVLDTFCSNLVHTPQGKRNDFLNTIAFQLAGYVGGGRGDGCVIEEELRAAALQAGLNPREIDRTLESAFESGLAAPLIVPERRLTDHLEQKSVAGRSLKIVRFEDVVEESAEFTWGDRIELHALNLFVGDPGVGKGFTSLALAAAVTNGIGMPDHKDQVLDGEVLLLTYEESPGKVKSRANGLGINMKRFLFLEGVKDADGTQGSFTIRDIALLENALEDWPGIRLLIIDPVLSTMGGRINTNSDPEIRAVLQPLVDLATRRRVTVVAVTHTNKTASNDWRMRVMGSTAFTGIPRSVLVFGKWKSQDPRVSNGGGVAHGKHNDSPEAPTILYGFIRGQFTFLDVEPSITHFDLLEPTPAHALRANASVSPQNGDAEKLAEFLVAELAQHRRLLADIRDEAKQLPFYSKRAWPEALRIAGVQTKKYEFGGPWEAWIEPASEAA